MEKQEKSIGNETENQMQFFIYRSPAENHEAIVNNRYVIGIPSSALDIHIGIYVGS